MDEAVIIQRLVMHEGVRLMPYRCTRGKLTIGIGRCIDTHPFTADELKVVGDWKHGITKNAAFYLLRNDIKRTVEQVREAISFYDRLDEERQYALIDMGFQLGVLGLKRFKKMLEQMGVGNYKNAAKECLNSEYAKQVPVRAGRIAKLIETGKFEV